MHTRHFRTLHAFAPPRQRGVYAVEFGLVFLIFFAVLYAVLCYGILFSVRLGMQNAAEEGARAGLRFQTSWPLRLAEAERVTTLRLAWMKYPPLPQAQLCELASPTVCYSSGAPTLRCNAALEQLCQIVVSVRYAPYASPASPWLPRLPDVLLPSAGNVVAGTFTLAARASMLLDERAL